jgi:hypothetical protein
MGEMLETKLGQTNNGRFGCAHGLLKQHVSNAFAEVSHDSSAFCLTFTCQYKTPDINNE